MNEATTRADRPAVHANLVRHVGRGLHEALRDFRQLFDLPGPPDFHARAGAGKQKLEVTLEVDVGLSLHGESSLELRERFVPNRVMVQPKIAIAFDPTVAPEAIVRTARHEMAHICFAVELGDDLWARESHALTEWLVRVVEFAGRGPPPFEIGPRAGIWTHPPRQTPHIDAALKDAAPGTELVDLLGKEACAWLRAHGLQPGSPPTQEHVEVVEWALGYALWKHIRSLERPPLKVVLQALQHHYAWYADVPGRHFLRSGFMGFDSLAHVLPNGRDDTQLHPVTWLSMVAQATQLADALAFDTSRSVTAWLEPFAVSWLDQPVLYLTEPRGPRPPAPPPRRIFEEGLTRLQRIGDEAIFDAAPLLEQLPNADVEGRVLWARLAAQLFETLLGSSGLGRPNEGGDPFDLPLIVPADERAFRAFAEARRTVTCGRQDSSLTAWLPTVMEPVNDWIDLPPASVSGRPILLVTSHTLDAARLETARSIAASTTVTWSVFARPRASERVEELYLARPDGPLPKDTRYREDFCRFEPDGSPPPESLAQRVRKETASGRLATPLAHLLALCRFGFHEVVL